MLFSTFVGSRTLYGCAILESSDQPFERRSVKWDVTELPVPTDVLVYTRKEWASLSKTRFYKTVMKEAVWVY